MDSQIDTKTDFRFSESDSITFQFGWAIPTIAAIAVTHIGLGALGWYLLVTKTWGDIGMVAKTVIGLFVLAMAYHVKQVALSSYKSFELISISPRGVTIAGKGLKTFEAADEFLVGLHADQVRTAVRFRDGYLFDPSIMSNKYPELNNFVLDHIVSRPDRAEIFRKLDVHLKKGHLASVISLALLGLPGPISVVTWMSVEQPVFVGILLSTPIWFALYRLSRPPETFERLLDGHKKTILEKRKPKIRVNAA